MLTLCNWEEVGCGQLAPISRHLALVIGHHGDLAFAAAEALDEIEVQTALLPHAAGEAWRAIVEWSHPDLLLVEVGGGEISVDNAGGEVVFTVALPY